MGIDLPPAPLFSGFAEEVNKILEVASYGHRGPFQKKRPTRLQGQLVAEAVFATMRERFAQLATGQIGAPSLQNWRVRSPQLKAWDARNPEVDLERRLVRARNSLDWWNQVPVASGLGNSAADRRRCIDLVHERAAGIYDFVELKIESNTPVYAAVEILLYGFAWLLSRHYRDAFGYSRKTQTLLDGREVRLCVLAPKEFYRSFDRLEFQAGLDTGVGAIAAPFGAAMSFLFLDFDLPGSESGDDVLRNLLDGLFSG